VAADQVALLRASQDFRKASVELAVTLKLDPKVTLFPLDSVMRQRLAPKYRDRGVCPI
jgi:hypothetical protein